MPGCSFVKSNPVSDDFRIEINTYSTEWRPSQYLQIRADGSCKYFIIPPGMDQNPVRRNFKIGRSKVKRIRNKIEKVGFFELKAEYLDKRHSTGWHIVMTVISDGRRHSVHTLATEIKPVIDIIKLINGYTPLPSHMKFLHYETF